MYVLQYQRRRALCIHMCVYRYVCVTIITERMTVHHHPQLQADQGLHRASLMTTRSHYAAAAAVVAFQSLTF